MNIYEHHEVLGWFFLPEDKDNREKWVPGVLKWDPAKGAEIELIGGFSSLAIPPLEPGVVHAITDETVASVPVQTIYLETEAGKKYSIWDAWMSSCSCNGLGKVNEERWLSGLVCVGEHILSEEKIFTKATFYIDELYYLINDGRILPPEWCQVKGIDRPGEKLENGTCLTPYMLPIIGGFRAGKFEGDTEDAHYSINTFATRPWSSEATEKYPSFKLNFMLKHQRHGLVLPISVDASISITLRKNTEEPEDLVGTASNLMDRFMPIHDLMRLATFQPCSVSRVQLQSRNNCDDTYLLKKFGEVAQPYESHDHDNMVFTLDNVSLENFLEKREYLTSTDGAISPWSILIGLCGYFSNYAEEYISQSFAAAEGFHTLCLGKGENYTDASGQSKNYCLNKRLKELYVLLPQKIQDKMKFDVEEWAKRAVKARNHAAHGGSTRPGVSTSLSDRYDIAVSVFLVTYLVVLNELGVPSEKICGALLNHPKISLAMSYCDKVRSMLES